MCPKLVQFSDVLQRRYALERELGRGGMATAYLAHDLTLDRRVVLNLPDLALDAADGLRREIDRWSRLTHPHILPVHDSGEAAGRLFYVTPYVEGESLRQCLDRQSQLPVTETIRIVCGIAEALDYAHRSGMVHRGISPEGILLAGRSEEGNTQPLVADFGVASAMDSATGGRRSALAYMSPERGRKDGEPDRRSDVYALGCIAYEMLAGVPPFSGPTAEAILARHAVDAVPPLRTVRDTVPEAVAQAIERALAKAPADRFDTAGEFARALADGHLLAQRRPSRPIGLAAVAGAGLAMGAVIGAMWLRGSASPVLPSAARMAVLPFVPASSDTALTRLGRDLAVTVSTSLDGVGGIEIADRTKMAAATADRAALSRKEATALARSVGARSVVAGTLARIGPDVTITLELRDTEADTSVFSGLAVTGPSDSVRALTDSVVWLLLRQVWRRGRPPTPSLTAVTTRSLPALRAFLDGERDVDLGRWEEASLAYRSAMEADSTFWLAYFRYSLAQYWREQPIEPEIALALFSHRSAFPERDRLLVEAWAAKDTLSVYLERLQAVTRRFPDYWPAWFLLGDRLLHAGALLGHDWRETEDAFNRTVTLNPMLRPAWAHMWMNAIGKDTVEEGRIVARLRELALPETPERVHNRLVLRLSFATQRANGVVTPGVRALMDTMARHNWEQYKDAPEQVQAWAWSPHLNAGYPAAQIELNRRSLELWIDGPLAAAQVRGIAWAWAVRGRWDSALATMHEAVAMMPEPGNQAQMRLDDYGLSALGAWLGVVDPGEALRRRAAAAAAIARLADLDDRKPQGRWVLSWIDGMSAFARQDREALKRARHDSRMSGHPQGEFLDRSLAAYDRALAGDRPGAGRELAALQWSCFVRSCGPRWAIMEHIATDRLAAATWLLESGDTTQAKRLLVWYESLEDDWSSAYDWVTTAPAYLMRARIAEAQSDPSSAGDYYQQFLRRYDSPMPAQRHLVEEARAGLARVSGPGEVGE